MATKSTKTTDKSPTNGSKKAAKKKGNGGKTIRVAGDLKRKAATRKPNALHDKLIKLFSRPNGATMHDTWEAGFYFPAMAALKIAERRGMKVTVVPRKKGSGELTRYIAKSR